MRAGTLYGVQANSDGYCDKSSRKSDSGMEELLTKIGLEALLPKFEGLYIHTMYKDAASASLMCVAYVVKIWP